MEQTRYVHYHTTNRSTGEWGGRAHWLTVIFVLPVNAWAAVLYGTCSAEVEFDPDFETHVYATKAEFVEALELAMGLVAPRT